MQVGATENGRWRSPSALIRAPGTLALSRNCHRVILPLPFAGEQGRQKDRAPGILPLQSIRACVCLRAVFTVMVAYALCHYAASKWEHSFATRQPVCETGKCSSGGADHSTQHAFCHRMLPTSVLIAQGSKCEIGFNLSLIHI